MEEKSNKSKYLQYALHAVILVGLVWAAVKYVNGEEVLEALRAFQYRFLPLMLLLSTAYLLLKAWRFVLLITPFASHLPKLVVYKAYVAGHAATVLPGGIAVRAGLMRQAGVPISESSVAVAVNSLWDQTIFLACALVAALWFPAARLPVLVIIGVLAAIVLFFLFAPTRSWLLGLAERIARRFKFEEQWERFLDGVPQVFTWPIVLGCLAITLVAFAFALIILDWTMRGVGLSIPYPTLFLAYILPTMLGRVLPMPGGGVGVTEAGMVGFLTSAAQINTDVAVAAVAIFRIVTIVFPILLGALVYFLFWRGEAETRQTQREKPVEASHASSSDF
jgi:uncharacterized protein (TIRG00374 family)